MFIFTILLDGFFRFFTNIRLMIWMMPPPLSFFFFLFFSSFFNCYCTEFLSRFTWWVMHGLRFFFFPDFRQDIFCFLFLLLWLSVGHSLGLSKKRDLLKRILLKIEIGSGNIQNLNPHHFLLLENCCQYQGLNPDLHPKSCLWYIYCKAALMQTWKLDNSSSRCGYGPYPLRFHVKEAGADAKLTQHRPLGVGIQYLRYQFQWLQHTPWFLVKIWLSSLYVNVSRTVKSVWREWITVQDRRSELRRKDCFIWNSFSNSKTTLEASGGAL
jgi:hypothetical protein